MPNENLNYLKSVVDLLDKIECEQLPPIKKAGELMADAIAADRLIHVYGGGGHTTLVMGEMFFRAGGLANINPIMETGLSVFNQAIKYLNLERCVNYGRSIMKYYNLQKGDLLVIFHNIGINAATIDAALEAKERGAIIIAVSSSFWQGVSADHPIRHPNKQNLFDLADVCIDDYNPVGDAVINVPGFDSPIAPVSNLTDFYIAHRMEIECVKACVARGIEPPVWRSANAPGGDEFNAKYLAKYNPRIKSL
ncbi:MAG: sugar isomerase domain-containing protein [Opitutaceae bacterium]|jgi:uncharacterized phosphosugar-binding protein